MSNTNAAELAAKELPGHAQGYQDGYTAALSNGLKWRKIDGEKCAPTDGGNYFIRNGSTKDARIVTASPRTTFEWDCFVLKGYTHYLPETDLLTKIGIE